MIRCRSASIYKGVFMPKCNKGRGCDTCWRIYKYREVGSLMSNVCYNLSQAPQPIDPQYKSILKSLYMQWDTIK